MAWYTIVYLVFSILSPCLVRGTDCPSGRDESNNYEALLHKNLFSCGYSTDYRPVKDHKKTVTVKVRIAIKYISFDSLEETFTVHSWLVLSWKDEFLSWDPSDFGGITDIQVESHEVWTPRLSLFNADASMYQSDSFFTTCLLTKDGTVTCVPHTTHSGICRTSLRYWPYDEQTCNLHFGSWMHTGEQVNFTFYKNKPVNRDDYQDGPGWKLLKVLNERRPGIYQKSANTTYPLLTYTFYLRREAAGPAAIVVVPSLVLVVITISSMLLDVKDNVRLLLTCFSLYGHFIYLSEIGYDIPKHSFDTPIILLFVRDSMIVTLFGIVSTLCLMAMRRRVVPPPTWAVTLSRLVTSGPGKYVVFTEFDPSNVSERKVLSEDGTSTANEVNTQATSDWVQLCNLLNSVLFIISFLTYVILFICLIPRD